ncbi:MAG TPA: class I SAM-dependent methyltransferase [Burkholderiales bacterium]|nr:class I SAM-dependent methyltransferase [Burkholderiales bacterium]
MDVSTLNRVDWKPRPDWLPDDAAIVRYLAARNPRFRYRKPRYQVQLVKDLAHLLPPGHCRILDIGAGSGLLGEAIAALFPGKSVTGVDIAPNPLATLRIPFARFDGHRIPFADQSFDCALFSNVLHHVKPAVRPGLLREALRVTGGGPLVVKDHLASAPLDGIRLWLLDVLGNAPFGFMVAADYLDHREWETLLRETDCAGEVFPVSSYRTGLWERCFPNRLEVCFRVSSARSDHSSRQTCPLGPS